MTHAIVTKLWNLAEAAKTHAVEEVRSLEPTLKDAARKVETAFENYHAAIDEWIARHFIPEVEKAKEEANKLYLASLREASDLYDRAKVHF